jgi:hypothetical protein
MTADQTIAALRAERDAMAQRIAELEARVARLEAQHIPRCAACQGDGQVRRSWGCVPCDSCDGKGY